jgi:tetratricopeptide (TPR) repeat protein
VWSLGVTLYECLTLHRPFQAPTREGLYQAIQSKDPPPIRRLNPAVSQDLRAVVETALQKDRDRRYQSAALLADDLDHHVLAERAIAAGERLSDHSKAGREHFARAVRHATMAVLLGSPRVLLYELRAHAAGHARDREAAMEAAAALRIRWPEAAQASYWAGFALQELKDPSLLDEAIAAFREAIRIGPGSALAHCNLGLALQAADRAREAQDALRRGHELGSRTWGWSFPSARWVEEAARSVEEEAAEEARALEHVAQGSTPEDPIEGATLARAALRAGKAAVAVAWSRAALEKAPKLAGDLGAGHRYTAAAARAAAEAAESAEVEALRRQALRWMTEDLDAWEERVDSGRARAVQVRQALSRYLHEPAFAAVRADAQARLPEPERKAWESQWKRVEEVLASL